MYCPNCGTQLPDGSRFCTNCGTSLAQPEQPQQEQYQQPQQQYQQPQQQQYQPYQQPTYGYAPMDRFAGVPMKWHKFLAYFAMWFSALGNLIMGIQCLSGSQYGSSMEADMVYRVFPSMKTADVLYGILLLATAVLAAYTAYSLLKLKKGAPNLLTVLYVVNAVASILYIILVVGAIGDYTDVSELISSAIVGVITSIVMIIINRIYYGKRMQFFVN